MRTLFHSVSGRRDGETGRGGQQNKPAWKDSTLNHQPEEFRLTIEQQRQRKQQACSKHAWQPPQQEQQPCVSDAPECSGGDQQLRADDGLDYGAVLWMLGQQPRSAAGQRTSGGPTQVAAAARVGLQQQQQPVARPDATSGAVAATATATASDVLNQWARAADAASAAAATYGGGVAESAACGEGSARASDAGGQQAEASPPQQQQQQRQEAQAQQQQQGAQAQQQRQQQQQQSDDDPLGHALQRLQRQVSPNAGDSDDASQRQTYAADAGDVPTGVGGGNGIGGGGGGGDGIGDGAGVSGRASSVVELATNGGGALTQRALALEARLSDVEGRLLGSSADTREELGAVRDVVRQVAEDNARMRQELSEFSRHAGALLQHVHSQVAALIAATAATAAAASTAPRQLPHRMALSDQLLLPRGGDAPHPPPALAWHQGEEACVDGDDAPELATALARAPTTSQQQQQQEQQEQQHGAAWRGRAAAAASGAQQQLPLDEQLSELPAYATRLPAAQPRPLPPHSDPSGRSSYPVVAGTAAAHAAGYSGHASSTAHASRRRWELESEEAGLPSYCAFLHALASARLPLPPGPLPRAHLTFLATGPSSEAALRAAVRPHPQPASEWPAYIHPQRSNVLDEYEEVHAPEADAYVNQLRAEEAARARAQAREQAQAHGGHAPPGSGGVQDYSRLYPPTFVARAAGSLALGGLRDAHTLALEAELVLSGMGAVAGGHGRGAAGTSGTTGGGGYTGGHAGIDAALTAASASPDRMAPLPPGVQRTWLPFAVEDSARAHPPALSPHASPRGGASPAMPPFGTFRGLATGAAGAPVAGACGDMGAIHCCGMHPRPMLPQWRIESFSTLGWDVRSESFEAGIATWRLLVSPDGRGDGKGTHLSVYLEMVDEIWAPSAEFKLTLLNQADGSKSISRSGLPCDVTLKLPCGAEVPAFSPILRAASPFFRDALEAMNGSTMLSVDGSLGAWSYILSDLYPLHDPPALIWAGVFVLLPVVHKYNFTKLLTRLTAPRPAFVKDRHEQLSSNPGPFIYIVLWLAVAERLQLDELRELCLVKLKGKSKQQLQWAITVEVGSDSDGHSKCAVRKEVEMLSHALLVKVLGIAALAP
ncbi:hypothetical protein FOA52_012725 [Chlamydomonas sp. UWO 241]|nr:hypothetical protein FOA52_012725 [Chlamydomonas sp. UWO 241]